MNASRPSPITPALLAAALAAALCAPAQAQETVIPIGLSSPLSGPQSAYGQDNVAGAKLAVDELNARKPRIGGKPVRFELKAEDDQADPKQGVAVAQKLADGGVRFVVGPYNSGVTMPASRVYDQAGIVVATVSSNPKITQQGYQRLFRIGAADTALGVKMAQYAAKELKLKRVAVIDDRSAYGQGLAQEFAAAAKASGMEVVKTEYVSDKTTDFTPVLTGIKAAKPDAVFFGGYSAQGGPMARQMRQLGINASLLGGDGICSAETAKLAGGDTVGENVWCTQGGAMINRANEGQAFIKAYRAANANRDPLTYAAAFYDGVHLFAHAMQQAGSTDPAKVAEAMQKGSYKGAAGTYEFDAQRDLKSSPVTVFNFKAGQPSAVTSY
ncbi:branched-chain amino acid ABC transporter substrate-binding protein [Aquincola sp. MAHUQ-54]|uniref:Branched-chain amino acid ABC transporter substrate-binding protein n=1 Tax=Aquincola agrisoli TaxID=3119538 RepID=A0AAW9Q6A5_9BURK